jgi:hypothetical protein
MPVQKQIAQRAAPDRRYRRDHDDPEEVQIPITRREYATRGKHRHARKVKVIQEHASSYSVESVELSRRRKRWVGAISRQGARSP